MFKNNANRKTLINKGYQKSGVSKIISENIVNDIFQIITLAFKNNEKVKISSFGTFFKKKKKKE